MIRIFFFRAAEATQTSSLISTAPGPISFEMMPEWISRRQANCPEKSLFF
jgi:hypothetical protein